MANKLKRRLETQLDEMLEREKQMIRLLARTALNLLGIQVKTVCQRKLIQLEESGQIITKAL